MKLNEGGMWMSTQKKEELKKILLDLVENDPEFVKQLNSCSKKEEIFDLLRNNNIDATQDEIIECYHDLCEDHASGEGDLNGGGACLGAGIGIIDACFTKESGLIICILVGLGGGLVPC